MNYRHNITLFLLLFMFFFLCPQDACCLAKEAHYLDWHQVLGIYDAASKRALEPIFKYMHENVIDAEGNPRRETELKRTLRNRWHLTFNPRNHRVLFHWGFNQDIKRYVPLLEEIDRQWQRDEYNMRTKYENSNSSMTFEEYLLVEKRKVLDYINTERNERNRMIIELVSKHTGLHRRSARALATILWDVHILADFSTPATAGLPETKSIRQDIIRHGFEDMFPREDIHDVADMLHKHQNNPAAMLEIIKQHLPRLLHNHWGNTLMQSGVTISLHEHNE